MRPIDADRLIETITCSCSMGGIMGTVVDAVYGYAKHMVETAPTIRLPQNVKWIPVTKDTPNNNNPVNVTWINRNPEPYYRNIKDVPFCGTAHYCSGKWWWYSNISQDMLDEYGESPADAMDDAIEVIAWAPLPVPLGFFSTEEAEDDT